MPASPLGSTNWPVQGASQRWQACWLTRRECVLSHRPHGWPSYPEEQLPAEASGWHLLFRLPAVPHHCHPTYKLHLKQQIENKDLQTRTNKCTTTTSSHVYSPHYPPTDCWRSSVQMLHLWWPRCLESQYLKGSRSPRILDSLCWLKLLFQVCLFTRLSMYLEAALNPNK